MHIKVKTLLLALPIIALSGPFSAYAEIGFSGAIQVDYDDTETNGISDSETDFRRAWVNFSKQTDEWKFTAKLDLQADEFDDDTFIDLVATYSGFGEHAKLTLGRHKTQFAMNWITSFTKLSLAERGGVVELHKMGRMDGVMVSGKVTSSVNYWVGVYDKEDFDGTATIGRLTYSHHLGKQQYLHFGGGLVFSNERDINNLEFAYGNGPFHMQSEYFKATYDSPTKSDTDGVYIEMGYFLNGSNSRPYKNGILGGPKPSEKYGDWQVVARYETGDGNYSDIGIGKIDASMYAVGLNWYYTNKTTFNISYMSGEAENSDDEGNELRLRAQYVF